MTTPTLSNKAMLVRLSISQWTARKYDKTVTNKVARDYGTNPDAGRYNKVLIAQDAIKTITKAANEARTYHYANTALWLDNGYQMLPADHYLKYTEKMREFKSAFDAAVSDFIDAYPDYVDDAKKRLNGMFNAADYPTLSQLRRRYAFDVEVMPLPTRDDFRVSLQASEVEAIQADIEARTKTAMQASLQDLWSRLYGAVSHIAERLSSPDAIFRDSLIGNVAELCGLLPVLNVLNDPNLETMRQTIETKLAGYDPQVLRDSKAARSVAASEAQAILNAMKGYVAPEPVQAPQAAATLTPEPVQADPAPQTTLADIDAIMAGYMGGSN